MFGRKKKKTPSSKGANKKNIRAYTQYAAKHEAAEANSEFHFQPVLRKFMALNAIRIRHTFDALTDRQKEFLTLLPLLFHDNYPSLPGFSGKECPIGIPDFVVTEEMILAAKNLSKGFDYKRQPYRNHDILALYLMGSPGTIAFSQESDFDIWLCHNDNLDEHQLACLQKKALAITQWGKSINLDITIFLVNPTDFRNGIYTPLSVESSGSTQHLLLLEEFYRTAILIAGRPPAWWIVPPEKENEYDSFIENLEKSRIIFPNQYINLGAVANIPADEFSGATLWQIYKGIDSPYKSLLKLMLMEAYASEYPDIKLLCMQYKKTVYEQEQPGFEETDPYLLMLHKTSQYLQQQNAKERLMLLRQCFYLKSHCQISKAHRNSKNAWRIDIMTRLVQEWEWDNYLINRLDYQDNWKFPDVLKEQKKLVDALTYSYRKLSEFFRKHNHASRISQRDLHILGRKLYAAFERKAGKIEIVNRQYKDQLLENYISFHQYVSARGDTAWKVYIGPVTLREVKNKLPLNQSAQIMKLLCWLYFNTVINKKTNFLIFDQNQQHIPETEILSIIQALDKTYPDYVLSQPKISTLSKPSYVENSNLFVNVGIDPFSSAEQNLSQLATSKTDAFKYGSVQQNLVYTLDLVYNTSWTEVMYFHYQGEEGILNCICQYLRWNQQTPHKKIMPSACNSFSCSRGELIARRVMELIKDVIDIFDHHDKVHQRFVFAIAKAFYLIWFEGEDPKFKKIKNYKALIRELGLPAPEFSSVHIDKHATDDLILPTIYQYNEANKIQFFYFNHIKNVDIYILDNMGALYYQRIAIEKDNVHINHFILFLNSVINRLRFDPSNDVSLELENDTQLAIYKMTKKEGEVLVQQQSNNQFPLPRQFLNIQAIGNPDDTDRQHFSIFCDDREFSVLDYGDNVYRELASYVVNNRPSGLRYPIYITDMDLSSDLIESQGLKSIPISQLLKYKQDIENRLNKAIKEV